MDNQGWIKIYRKSIDSDIWTKKPSTWYKVWQYILLKVNHKDNDDFKKGQNFFNFRQELRAVGVDVTYSVVDHTMRFLKSAKQIATQKTTRGVIITVLNYNLYQKSSEEENETKSETESEVKAKSLRNKSDTINKNDKNDKNINTMASPKIKNISSIGDIIKKKSGISTAWQDKAFRYAKALNIELKDNDLKVRWLKFFKVGMPNKIDRAYSYLSDYPPFNNLPNFEAKIKYFFWYYANK